MNNAQSNFQTTVSASKKKSKLPLSESNNDFFESLFEPEPESNP